uniref:Uncharacterized protein n=1 Tax=Romanomermis culicivorax TaxID=13658 RepID=A0A915HYK9_ROMCU
MQSCMTSFQSSPVTIRNRTVRAFIGVRKLACLKSDVVQLTSYFSNFNGTIILNTSKHQRKFVYPIFTVIGNDHADEKSQSDQTTNKNVNVDDYGSQLNLNKRSLHLANFPPAI